MFVVIELICVEHFITFYCFCCFFFFFSSRRRHTRCREVSWARRCVQETGTWEVGDLLFSVVNVARFLKVDEEISLNSTIDKFIRRFSYIEQKVKEKGIELTEISLEEMNKLWEKSKKQINIILFQRNFLVFEEQQFIKLLYLQLIQYIIKFKYKENLFFCRRLFKEIIQQRSVVQYIKTTV
eukprot:TRINITY_DN1223_c0_g1_i3.p3 TRINITY_DN1223_c0_g1~~TRINITY_DN1223_c0_g1_i3.p3  ORF type:complete len:182 (-),score=33.06 TRINITY_DN1223_c0_g1_i3:37-582(-)